MILSPSSLRRSLHWSPLDHCFSLYTHYHPCPRLSTLPKLPALPTLSLPALPTLLTLRPRCPAAHTHTPLPLISPLHRHAAHIQASRTPQAPLPPSRLPPPISPSLPSPPLPSLPSQPHATRHGKQPHTKNSRTTRGSCRRAERTRGLSVTRPQTRVKRRWCCLHAVMTTRTRTSCLTSAYKTTNFWLILFKRRPWPPAGSCQLRRRAAGILPASLTQQAAALRSW